MVKAVRSVGLSIGSVTFDGSKLEIVIKNEDSGDNATPYPTPLRISMFNAVPSPYLQKTQRTPHREARWRRS